MCSACCVKHEPAGVAAGELARLIGVPQNTMSAHLAVLSRADLVLGERHSRTIIYRANLVTLQDVTLFLLRDSRRSSLRCARR